jgi:hypothetical protein
MDSETRQIKRIEIAGGIAASMIGKIGYNTINSYEQICIAKGSLSIADAIISEAEKTEK